MFSEFNKSDQMTTELWRYTEESLALPCIGSYQWCRNCATLIHLPQKPPKQMLSLCYLRILCRGVKRKGSFHLRYLSEVGEAIWVGKHCPHPQKEELQANAPNWNSEFQFPDIGKSYTPKMWTLPPSAMLNLVTFDFYILFLICQKVVQFPLVYFSVSTQASPTTS